MHHHPMPFQMQGIGERGFFGRPPRFWRPWGWGGFGFGLFLGGFAGGLLASTLFPPYYGYGPGYPYYGYPYYW